MKGEIIELWSFDRPNSIFIFRDRAREILCSREDCRKLSEFLVDLSELTIPEQCKVIFPPIFKILASKQNGRNEVFSWNIKELKQRIGEFCNFIKNDRVWTLWRIWWVWYPYLRPGGTQEFLMQRNFPLDSPLLWDKIYVLEMILLEVIESSQQKSISSECASTRKWIFTVIDGGKA